MKSQIAILMGLIIAVADVYWTYTSYTDVVWLGLGVLIFVADVVWLAIDFNLMEPAKPRAMTRVPSKVE
jgi:hypothetical protein